MNNEDHAIVIGIRRYPMFGKSERDARDLKGPDQDAAAIYEWLTDPNKGGVPPDHVTYIRSQDFPDPFPDNIQAEPTEQKFMEALNKLHALGQKNDQQNKGTRIGRRLYIYASGHGFAKKRAEGAVFMADATLERTNHVSVSAWAEWFYHAGYFDEVVLWMDCCMIRELSIDMRPAGYRRVLGGNGRMFAAFSARFPRLAVEREFENGEFHGVFTYTLLRGLNGAAADPDTKQITSQSLKEYLINAMPTFMSDEDRKTPDISKEPDFWPDDPIVFGTVVDTPTHAVKLQLPANATGQTVRIVTGSPPEDVKTLVATSAMEKVKLPKGQYFAKIDTMGWSEEILVAGGADAQDNGG
jgi:hypothetical protein